MSDQVVTPVAIEAAPITSAPVESTVNQSAPAAPEIAALLNPTSTPQAPIGAWHESITDEALRGYVEAKGFQSVEDVIKGHQNIEKLVGDKVKLTALPGEDATPEQLAEFYTKLGRPDKPEDYKLQAPEGADKAFTESAAKWMHDLGLNTKQAGTLAEQFNTYMANHLDSQVKQMEIAEQNDIASLKKEWGQNYDANLEKARRAARAFGCDDATSWKIQEAIGANKMLTMFSNIGNGFSEHTMHGGNQSSPFGMSVEGARVRHAEILRDPALRSKYLNKDSALRNEMDTLNRIIAGAA